MSYSISLNHKLNKKAMLGHESLYNIKIKNFWLVFSNNI